MAGLFFLDSTKKMPMMSLPVRTTVADLGEGVRVMIAPGSNLTLAELANAGPVTDLVAPSLFHCGGIPRAREAFPKARVWGPENAAEEKREIRWTNFLGKEPWPYSEALKAIPLDGMPKIREWVFVHAPTKSLIVTDLCFNLTAARGAGSWMILNAFGTYRRLGMSRFFAGYIKDKMAFEKSLEHLFSHDFNRMVVSHGDTVENGAREKLLAALKERGYAPALPLD